MALTRREQIILYITIVSVVLLIVNAYVLEPLLTKRAETAADKLQLQGDVEQALATLDRKRLLTRRWAEMQDAGLGADVQKAEAMVYRYLEDISGRASLELGSVQPDRRATEGRLGEIDFVVSGTGSMQAVTRFLWHLETADIPLRVKSFQLGAKNEAAEAMTIQIELSTVYIKPQPAAEKEA